MKTEIKCRGCQKDIPEMSYNVKTQMATWFGMYKNNILLDWICAECWDKGIRYERCPCRLTV